MRTLTIESQTLQDNHSSDPLSPTLQQLNLPKWRANETSFSYGWAVDVPNNVGSFYVVRKGSCRIRIDSTKEIIDLDKGDIVLLAHGNHHRIYDTLTAPAIPVTELYNHQEEAIGAVQQRSITSIIHGHFDVPANGGNPYRASLPAIVKLNIGENALMRSAIPMLDALNCEHESTEVGRQVVIDQIVKLLLVQTIRGYALRSSQTQQFESQSAANWLRGTLDPSIGPVLSLIHARPAEPWTVRGLAKQINMSKSSFSEKFRDIVGRPPLQYLTEYRIHKACQMLHETKLGVKEIASQVGYESASSFSNAFKRWTGMAPAAYRKVG